MSLGGWAQMAEVCLRFLDKLQDAAQQEADEHDATWWWGSLKFAI